MEVKATAAVGARWEAGRAVGTEARVEVVAVVVVKTEARIEVQVTGRCRKGQWRWKRQAH